MICPGPASDRQIGRYLAKPTIATHDRQALTSILDVLVADLGVSEVQAELAGARADAARAWIALCVAQGLGTAEGLSG